MTEYKDNVDANIRVAVNPSGDLPSLRQREIAAQYLLGHADVAYPRLVELVRDKPESLQAPRLVELIGLLKRDESVVLLSELMLQGLVETSRAAALALARIATPAAYQALEEGLHSPLAEVRIAAINAVRITDEKRWCTPLQILLKDKDANLRYYAVNAATALQCLNKDELNTIARQEVDEQVRTLVLQLLQAIGND